MKKHLKDFFIPHEGNDYAPQSLQKMAITGMVVLVVLSFTFANLHAILWITSDWMVSAVLPSVVVDLTNEERVESALGALKRNPALDEAARLKAQDMAKNEYFAHYSPDGISPWYWFAQADYNFVNAGENLAIHFTDSAELMDAWMDSPTHRTNIMNGNYTEIGVGTAEGTFDGYDTVYVVQLFGTPAAAPASVDTEIVQVAQAAEIEPEPTTVASQTIIETESTVAEEVADVLAQEVTLTEDVVIVAAEPEPITVEEVVSEPVVSPTATSSADVVDMEVTETGVVLFSDLVSTSTGGVPASISPEDAPVSNEASYIFEVLTQPHVMLQMLYVLVGLFVLGSLLLSILIEIRRQQPVQIVYSGALLALMTGLFYVHSALSVGAVVL
tara:strand:+ start:636 stop:1793 length:1158 start_codon:yes stop_codon:yes gene_type:complete